MKIKNLAFCGVMASILGLTGAYAAGDATIIASKAYVDARDNLKQNEDKRVTTTLSTYNQTSHTDAQKQADYPSMYTLDTAVSNLSTTIGTNALDTNVLADGVDGTKLTKASAITAAKSTSKLTTVNEGVASMGAGDDTHFPTTKAVADTLKDLDHKTNTAVTNASTAVTAVTQTNGQVSVTSGTLSAAAIDSSAKAAGNILENADDTDLVVVGGVKDTVARQGTLEQAWNQEFNESAATAAGATNLHKASINGRNPETDELYMDEFVPTVAAVEKRVRLAESNAQSNSISNHDSNTAFQLADAANKAPSVNTVKRLADTTEKVTRDTSTQALTVATSGATDNTAPTTLTYATDMATMATAVNAKLNKNTAITASTDAMNIVTYDANGLVTGGKKLNNSGLNNINAASGGDTCSARNPCVLTYTGTNYKWTQMDTDSLDAVADTNS